MVSLANLRHSRTSEIMVSSQPMTTLVSKETVVDCKNFEAKEMENGDFALGSMAQVDMSH